MVSGKDVNYNTSQIVTQTRNTLTVMSYVHPRTFQIPCPKTPEQNAKPQAEEYILRKTLLNIHLVVISGLRIALNEL